MSSDATGEVVSGAVVRQELVPKLRFPEFRYAGNWAFQPLREVAAYPPDKINSKNLSAENYLSTESILPDFAGVKRSSVLPTASRVSQFLPGDVLVSNIRPYLKKVWQASFLGGASNDVLVIRARANVDRRYLASLLKHERFIDFVSTTAKGVKMPRGDTTSLMDFPFPLPPEETEQRKIADCLSSLDAVIAAEGERLATLREHKKGLLQALFPVEGQTTPRLRFPEFRDAGEWVEKPLGEVLACPAAYGANAAAVPYDPGLPTYLRITDISEEGRFVDSGRMSVEVVADGSNTMQIGDIALARTGASVGKAYLHTDADSPLVFAGFLIRVRPDQRRAVSQLVFQYMQTERYWAWVTRTSARSGQPGINAAEYGALPIPLPSQAAGKTLGEQQRIADCLSTLDDLISTVADEVDALRTYKLGLIQQLFPSSSQVVT